jgi:hypothetical protein
MTGRVQRFNLRWERCVSPSLVCCEAGMSRSVSIAAGGLALADGRALDESLAVVVGSGPADVSPRLLVQLGDAIEPK